VAKKHGGQINFTTAPGAGTTFILRLPLIERTESARLDTLAP